MIVRPKRIYRKRIPYGMQNFEDVIKEDCYYVDKTPFIEQIEESNKYFFFIRPRRFGKTLTLSMLENYYDINKKDKFEEIFGKLYIGQNPTPEHNTYLIIHLNFAEVAAGLDDYKDGLDNHCRLVFNFFCDIYAHILPTGTKEGLQQEPDAVSKLRFLCQKCQEVGKKIYLFIDEYDNFTNMILAHEEHLVRYRNQTHGEGYLRQFFNTIKGAAGNTLGRVFVTGVSPVTMDDLTSGFNIGTNYSLSPDFNEMTGFTEEEVRKMLDYYGSVLPFNHTTDELIKVMKPWYDNYCFAEEALNKSVRMFNCDMVLYYLRNYMDYGRSPRQMIDPNTKTDYGKMKKLLQFDKLDGERKGIIRKIAEEGQIVAQLEEQFSAYQIPKAEIFPSLLFYYGMLTIKGTRGSKLILGIPNNNVRKQYYGYLEEEYQAKSYVDTNRLTDYYYDMAYEGVWEEGLRFMAEAYAKVSSVRDGIESERNLQGFFMAYLNLNDYYITAPELELNHGYCDIFLLPDHTHYASQHSYILELKVLSRKEFDEELKDVLKEDGSPMKKSEKQWLDAVEQIRRYADAPRVEALRQGTTLHKIIMQFKGWELARIEEIE